MRLINDLKHLFCGCHHSSRRDSIGNSRWDRMMQSCARIKSDEMWSTWPGTYIQGSKEKVTNLPESPIHENCYALTVNQLEKGLSPIGSLLRLSIIMWRIVVAISLLLVVGTLMHFGMCMPRNEGKLTTVSRKRNVCWNRYNGLHHSVWLHIMDNTFRSNGTYGSHDIRSQFVVSKLWITSTLIAPFLIGTLLS